MPLMLEICLVVLTLALVGATATAIRLMQHTNKLIDRANRSLVELPGLITDLKQVSARADALLLVISDISRSVQAPAAKLEHLASRTGQLANSLLDEVERPISTVARLIQATRYAARHLVTGWMSRNSGRTTRSPQGETNGEQQRWLDDGGVPGRNDGRSRSRIDFGSEGR